MPEPTAMREAIHERDRERCVNCRATAPDVTLDVHHIVPRGQGGSNRLANLALLCRQCHDAAHGERMAPTVDFESTGQMTNAEFDIYREFFARLECARFDANSKCWRIPKADFERLVKSLDELPTPVNGGDH